MLLQRLMDQVQDHFVGEELAKSSLKCNRASVAVEGNWSGETILASRRFQALKMYQPFRSHSLCLVQRQQQQTQQGFFSMGIVVNTAFYK
jgi:lipase chaperone LimK